MADRTRPRRVTRFSAVERALHWLVAVTFLIMLASGLALYVPALAAVVDRPTAKAWHVDAAVVMVAGGAMLLGTNRHRLWQTLREFDRFGREDARWLLDWSRRRRLRPPAVGRFNPGQKLNAAAIGGLLGVLTITGVLLLAGERDTAFRFAGTVLVHDWAALAAAVLVAGHLYLALLHPPTRPALRGMVTGEVDREWARRHHPAWVPAEDAGGATGDGRGGPATPGDGTR